MGRLAREAAVKRTGNAQPPVIGLTVPRKEGRFGLHTRCTGGAKTVICKVTQGGAQHLIMRFGFGVRGAVIVAHSLHGPTYQSARNRLAHQSTIGGVRAIGGGEMNRHQGRIPFGA